MQCYREELKHHQFRTTKNVFFSGQDGGDAAAQHVVDRGSVPEESS